MLVAIHDSDKTRFPNLALMKISAYHKAEGDHVVWFERGGEYDRVYSSKVFTFTPEDPDLPPDTIKGGTGYGSYESLPDEIDWMIPDYSIYPDVNYAIGYLTRGCTRACPWCVVPKKEGKIKPYRYWTEIARPGIRDVVFMDNNVLASPFGLEQMEELALENLRVDFNQGLDARLITPEVAKLLSQLKWIQHIRMAADTDAMLNVVLDKIELLRSYGVKPYRIFAYVLTQDIPSAEKRCIALRDVGANPFAQPYRDFTTNEEPSKELKHFARWVNNKAVFKSCKTFAEYDQKVAKNWKNK